MIMNPIYQIVLFFIVTQILALITGVILIDNSDFFAFMSVAPAEPYEEINAFYFIGLMVLMAIILFIVLMLPIRDLFIKVLEFLATVVASTIIIFVILYSGGLPYADVLAFFISLGLYICRYIIPSFRNVLAIIAAAGVGAVIGFSLDPLPVCILVIAVSFYDMIAVWWTKHMVEFARYFSKRATTFIVTAVELKKIKVKRKGRMVTEVKPLTLQLGSGDLAIPAIFIVSVYKFGSIFIPLLTLVGATIGLYVVVSLAQKERKIFPAMPPIAAGALIALLVALAIQYLLTTTN
jgi:presenilin-like A22 family membrane protease